jgi:hypothetical protein
MLDDKGDLVNADTQQYLGKFLQQFESWIALHMPVHQMKKTA